MFKSNLICIEGKVDEIEREENQKNHIRDFLRDTFYKETTEINTKDNNDLVITQTIFENLLACGNHVGLFSEGIDFSTKRLLGNFPQAYSHLALINTATLFSQKKFISKFIKP